MKNGSIMKSLLFVSMIVAILLILACAPAAPTASTVPATTQTATVPDKVYEFKMSTMEPETSPVGMGSKQWVDKIVKDSKGRIKITVYWGGTITNIKEAYTELATGVYDLGPVLPQFAAMGVFPLAIAMQDAFFHGSPDLATSVKVYKEVLAKYPEIKAEYSKVKIQAIYTGNFYDIYTSKKAIRSIADIKGLSLRKGGVPPSFATALGAEAANLSIADAIQLIQKGTLDGGFVGPDQLKTVKVADVVKYGTLINYCAGPFADLSMGMKRWDSLPPDIQKIFEDNGDYLTTVLLDARSGINKEGFDYAKQLGVEFISLNSDDTKKLSDIGVSLAVKAAADLDAKGIPGTKIYQDVQSLLAKYRK